MSQAPLDNSKQNLSSSDKTGKRTRKKRRPPWWLMLLSVYIVSLTLLSVSNFVGPERTWLGALNLYLPQWLWAIPGILLTLITAIFARRSLWIPLLCLMWVFGPIMGFCWHLPNLQAAPTAGIHVRVMTYNVKWGTRDCDAMAADIAHYNPDIIQMQDSNGALKAPLLKVLAGWTIRVSGQYTVASRHQLSELVWKDISFPGCNHHCVSATLTMYGIPITIYNVHLLSPREGLVSIRHRYIEGLVQNVNSRLTEASIINRYLQKDMDKHLIVTGDLNGPVQSLSCRYLLDAGLRDAYSEVGFGYGYSYGEFTPIHSSYVRLDHVLVNSHWHIRSCQVGNEIGSDHAPVIADLLLITKRM